MPRATRRLLTSSKILILLSAFVKERADIDETFDERGGAATLTIGVGEAQFHFSTTSRITALPWDVAAGNHSN